MSKIREILDACISDGMLTVPIQQLEQYLRVETQTKTPNDWAQYIAEWGKRKGWDQNWNDPEKFMLMVTEIAESMEEWRKYGSPWIPDSSKMTGEEHKYIIIDGKPEGVFVELADTVIRIMHFFGHYGVNLNEMLEMKMAYNEKRPYRHGGKHA